MLGDNDCHSTMTVQQQLHDPTYESDFFYPHAVQMALQQKEITAEESATVSLE